MGVVIPFVPRAKRSEPDQNEPATPDGVAEAELAVMEAVRNGGGVAEVLAAAGPLIDLCHDKYGFTLMQDGIPRDADVLARSLLTLWSGLSLIEPDFRAAHRERSFGVYLGKPHLSWFDDGYGELTGLAVPVDVEPGDLAHFVRPKLRQPRSTNKL